MSDEELRAGVELVTGEARARYAPRETAHPRGESAVSLRWILVHMIEQHARHNGHADFLREAIDGCTGE